MHDRIASCSAVGRNAKTRRSIAPSGRSGSPTTSARQQVKAQLEIFVEAARQRGEALDHVLIFGPPGLGKTTLAHIIANELGVNLRQTSGPVLERPGDLAALLTNLQPRDVLFVDEIHRLSPVVEEVLYPAMEDFQLDIMIGEGPAARSIKLDLPPFTLVGATTRAGLLTSPLRDRFGIVQRLEFYSARRARADRARARPASSACRSTRRARRRSRTRSRGTPRIANRLLRRVRDFAEVKATAASTSDVARAALDLLEVDPQGFDALDRKLLLDDHREVRRRPGRHRQPRRGARRGARHARGRHRAVPDPAGIPMRTARGRIATRNAYLHFGLQGAGARRRPIHAAVRGRA